MIMSAANEQYPENSPSKLLPYLFKSPNESGGYILGADVVAQWDIALGARRLSVFAARDDKIRCAAGATDTGSPKRRAAGTAKQA